ncbi:MAG: NrdH-redoxin [Candidatus Buchananbacteria bacterium CG10_big_fil_rev_8_21_14_0_10_42_9]|uniref:NrdH-redoxin n=1 Tax=Candidatus Buchananbacteria bacterium CG10_big_fil_rev_8_21_14_0_10_42_9 TaxID=1974526 RepID=A0A2H0W1Q3_9BACT|nr:MAG: NrdH-redoxin [Candidatus Buchananbacteria bacterium CG10_big_fil_rev_8_21_14_0_10_42_9]
MANVTIYSTPTCTFCKMSKDFFKANNIDYTEHDVSSDQAKAQEMIDKSGQMAVPVIDIDGEIVVGFDEAKLKQLLKL